MQVVAFCWYTGLEFWILVFVRLVHRRILEFVKSVKLTVFLLNHALPQRPNHPSLLPLHLSPPPSPQSHIPACTPSMH